MRHLIDPSDVTGHYSRDDLVTRLEAAPRARAPLPNIAAEMEGSIASGKMLFD